MKTKLGLVMLLAIIGWGNHANAQSKKASSNSIEKIHAAMNLATTSRFQSNDQRSLIQKNDSIYSWNLAKDRKTLKLNSKEIDIVYDGHNNLISFIVQSRKTNTWVDSIQTSYTYDANNNLTNTVVKNRDTSTWVNFSQVVQTYDANNNLTNILAQTWSGSAWVNDEQESYTYDAKNNRTGFLYQLWTSGAWVNFTKGTYTYDTKNNLKTELFQRWSSNIWVNENYTTYTYDANNNMINYKEQNWNTFTSAWEDNYKMTCTYNTNNKRTGELGQIFYSTWEDYSKGQYTYDANNNITRYILQVLDDTIWAMAYQEDYVYDSNNFVINDSYKTWNVFAYKLSKADSNRYYFQAVPNGVNDSKVQEVNITVFPNPGSGKYTITSNSNINSLEIYNLLGDRVYFDIKFNHPASGEIDISNFQNGIYFIRILMDDGKKVYSERIVKQ